MRKSLFPPKIVFPIMCDFFCDCVFSVSVLDGCDNYQQEKVNDRSHNQS